MRALVLILDGAGVGNAPDAAAYDDRGADTLGHVFLHRQALELPHLFSLGLRQILSGNVHDAAGVRACYGRMQTASPGKNALTGHWEIAGAVVKEPFARCEMFPAPLIEAIQLEAKIEFIGNRPGNSPGILEEFGETHLATGCPILYACDDSAMHIAAHEEVIPRKRLYEICRVARRHGNACRIGRVVAEPFAGTPGHFIPAAGRASFSITPPRTILNALTEAGFAVEGVGRAAEIFGPCGITRSHPADSNRAGMKAVEQIWREMHDGLIFATLSDFDRLHGSNRDLHGFASALAEFDAWLGSFLPQVQEDDLVIVTSGLGNDPTFRGRDRTREEVPVFAIWNGKAEPLGTRETLADVAATLLAYFDLQEKWPRGRSLIPFERKPVRPFYHPKH
jgi:phosphopentomutase